MDIPKYLHILWMSKWLLAVGLLVAIAAAFLAGYTIVDGRVESRTPSTYRAATTLLVGSASQPIFGSELSSGDSAPQASDLTQTAVVYAYIISGSEIRHAVEGKIGALSTGESISAVRRTTQPDGDEQFPGRFTLPIIDILGVADEPGRAEELSRTASEVFQDYVASEQRDSGIPAAARVQLSMINEGASTDVSKSNSVLPLLVTGIGVFLIFVIAAFVVWNVRQSRARELGRTRASTHAREGAPSIEPRLASDLN